MTRRDFGKLAIVSAGALLQLSALTAVAPANAQAATVTLHGVDDFNDVYALSNVQVYTAKIRRAYAEGRCDLVIRDSRFRVFDEVYENNVAPPDVKQNRVCYVGDSDVDVSASRPFIIVYRDVGYDADGGAIDLVVDCASILLTRNRSTSWQSGTLYGDDYEGVSVWNSNGGFVCGEIRDAERGQVPDGARNEWPLCMTRVDCYLTPAGAVSAANLRTVTTSQLESLALHDTVWVSCFEDIDQPERYASHYDTLEAAYASVGAESIGVHGGTVVDAYLASDSWLATQSRDGADLAVRGSQGDSTNHDPRSSVAFVSNGVAKQSFSWRGTLCSTTLGVGRSSIGSARIMKAGTDGLLIAL